MTRLMHLATTALIFALVAAASLMALNKWHYDSLGFYVDQEGTIPADLGNYPTGITRYAYVNHRAPTAPCIDADTEEPILHSVVASSSLHSSPTSLAGAIHSGVRGTIRATAVYLECIQLQLVRSSTLGSTTSRLAIPRLPVPPAPGFHLRLA